MFIYTFQAYSNKRLIAPSRIYIVTLYQLQVAQSVVSDILASPLGHSSAVDPDDIIDNLVEDIKATLKEEKR